MEQPTILISKLTPPIPSYNYMRRSSLIKKLKSKADKKVCLLHSGAGFGKSSALAQYFQDTKEAFSWYSISEEDDNILPFLRYLVHSIRRVIPEFGSNLLEDNIHFIYPKETELTRWYSLFCNELAKINAPFTFVLDDYHLIDHVFHINYVIEKIIEFLPPSINLVIASRIRPKWTVLLKLKLNGQLVELKEQDFMFSEEEIQVFFEDYHDKSITNVEAENILKLTEGWAIAIQLIAVQLDESNKTIADLTDFAFNDLFSYLSEEVFSNMTPKNQLSLLSFSIFPVFSALEIEEFFGNEELVQFEILTSSHSFIQKLSDSNTYRFHSLFQQFLEDKWLQVNSDDFYKTHKEVASYFKEKNNIVQALYHAVKSKDEAFLARMIIQNANSMILAGQFDWLLDLMKDHLSPSTRAIFYELYYFEGECHRYRAFYEKARKSFEVCLTIAEDKQNVLFICRANAGIAHIYLDTIQPALAKSFLEEAIKWANESKEISLEEQNSLKRLHAENLVNLGKANEASEWVTSESLDPFILKNGNLDARIYLRTGMLHDAVQILESRLGDELAIPDSHRETAILLSFIYSLTGEIEKSKKAANKGIEIGIKEKSAFVEAVGWIRKGHAEILYNPFDLNTPESLYLKAVQRMDDLEVSRAKAEPYMGLSILKSRQGKLQEAISYGEMGLRETIKSNDYWLSAYIMLGLSIVYYENDELEKAEEKCQEASALFCENGDIYGEMISNYWLSRIYADLQMSELCMASLQSFAKICVEHNFLFFLKKETVFGPVDLQVNYPLLKNGSKLLKEVNNPFFESLKEKMNVQDDISYPGYSLRLQLLGSFTLFKGIYEFEDRKWQREKSKELLTYLYLHKNRFVPKEELISNLFKESDEKKTNRDFKVILNALLKVIEPNREAREESYFILRKQSSYRLNPEAVVKSDLEIFNDYVTLGINEKAASLSLEHLMKAELLYIGSMLEDKPSIEWIAHERDKTEQQYLLVLERLAQTSTRIKDFEKTIYWSQKLLRLDPTWEEAYRLLMFAYYQLQNRTQAVKWYERCVATLHDELRVEPMQTTIQMYEMIVNYG
ncbi:MAG: BTAD domain-containing putative transcriptional regulator [Psychrobacillus psychrodurans]